MLLIFKKIFKKILVYRSAAEKSPSRPAASPTKNDPRSSRERKKKLKKKQNKKLCSPLFFSQVAICSVSAFFHHSFLPVGFILQVKGRSFHKPSSGFRYESAAQLTYAHTGTPIWKKEVRRRRVVVCFQKQLLRLWWSGWFCRGRLLWFAFPPRCPSGWRRWPSDTDRWRIPIEVCSQSHSESFPRKEIPSRKRSGQTCRRFEDAQASRPIPDGEWWWRQRRRWRHSEDVMIGGDDVIVRNHVSNERMFFFCSFLVPRSFFYSSSFEQDIVYFLLHYTQRELTKSNPAMRFLRLDSDLSHMERTYAAVSSTETQLRSSGAMNEEEKDEDAKERKIMNKTREKDK